MMMRQHTPIVSVEVCVRERENSSWMDKEHKPRIMGGRDVVDPAGQHAAWELEMAFMHTIFS